MIQLLRHHEIDPQRWDACLRRARQPLVYLQYWYLEVVCAGQWEALVEIQAGEYLSVFPVPVKKRLGRKVVYQPFFTQQLGLVTTPASTYLLAQDYLQIVSTEYAQVQHYQMPLPPGMAGELPSSWEGRLRPNYELSLAPAYHDLKRQYSTNLSRNLKKAAQASIQVESAAEITALLDLFRETKGKELPELRPRHYQVLAALYEQARRHGAGDVWEVREQGNLLASAFLLRTPHRITFLLGASSVRGRQLNAMAFLLDQRLQAEAGFGKTFDFEGSEVPGVANFYASFGALPVPYLSLTTQPNPLTLPWTLHVFTSLAKRLR